MAYPTGTLGLVLEDVDRQMVDLRTYAQARRDQMAAGAVSSTLIFALFSRLRQARASFAAAAATPGIAAYAQEQKAQPGLDVVAEFNGVNSAIDGVTTEIAAVFPKDGSGFLLAQTLGADGPVDRTFAPAATAGLRGKLDTLTASIA